MSASRPTTREEFEIALICALPIEYNATSLIFDEFWDEEGDEYGRAPGDLNRYTAGRVGRHNVVLALLPQMGKRNAASAAASMRSSFENIHLALLVGVCGGAPYNSGSEVLLGDVVISQAVVEYDFGRKYPDRFLRKDITVNNQGPATKDVRALVAQLETDRATDRLHVRTAHFLKELQNEVAQTKRKGKYDYPGISQDRLFRSDYRHKHYLSPSCACKDCFSGTDPVCDQALELLCAQVGCDDRNLIKRERLRKVHEVGKAPEVLIHTGRLASGDSVIKSATDRDRMNKQDNVIAFDMEGAGVCDELPCLIIKSVCDYADSHKNKRWQNFAAATAAAASKAILEFYIRTKQKEKQPETKKGHWMVPFGRNEGFVGREEILTRLVDRITPLSNTHNCQRTVIEGLGGIGKTQIALEAIFHVSEKHPECSIFWVPALDQNTFHNSYQNIARLLGISTHEKHNFQINNAVKAKLSKPGSGPWLLIIDNADDSELLFGDHSLHQYLPFDNNGSILFTTRNHEISVRLDVNKRGIFPVPGMTLGEATEMLKLGLSASQCRDTSSTNELVEFLISLPLAIKQASAYMAKTGITTTQYLSYCKSNDERLINLLSNDFEDCGRYNSIKNPITTTWLISFSQISKVCPLAQQYLRAASFYKEKGIPLDILPLAADKMKRDEAIGTLKAYAFIYNQSNEGPFDMHRLVRLAMRNWLDQQRITRHVYTNLLQSLSKSIPPAGYKHQSMWEDHLPHLISLVGCGKSDDEIAREKLISGIAETFWTCGNYKQALLFNQYSYEILAAVRGKEHYTSLVQKINIADTLRKCRKLAEAEQIYREVFELYKSTLGMEHRDTIGSMLKLARSLNDMGEYEKAEEMLKELCLRSAKVLGEEHPKTLDCFSKLGCCLYGQNRFEEAKKIHWRVYELSIKVSGSDHRYPLYSKNHWAECLRKLGCLDEAEDAFREIVEQRIKALGKDHPRTIASTISLAGTLAEKCNPEEAVQLYQRALAAQRRTLDDDHPTMKETMQKMEEALGMIPKPTKGFGQGASLDLVMTAY